MGFTLRARHVAPLCRSCGREAGFVHRERNACRALRDKTRERVYAEAQATALSRTDLPKLKERLLADGATAFVPTDEIREILLRSYEAAVERCAHDHIVSAVHMSTLAQYQSS